MAFDYSAASPILKEVYLPALQELLNNATPLLASMEKEITPVEGGNFVISIHRTRNNAAAIGRSEGSTLPTAGQQGYVRAIVPVKQLYSRINVSGKAIAATRSNKGAFLRALEAEMKYVMTDTKRGLNRQLNGDGTGALAYWTGADNTSPATVDDNLGNGTTQLGVGSITCDLIDASDNSTKLGDSIAVTRGAVSTATTSVSWTGSVSGTADGDYLVLEDSLGNEMTGIQGVISDANPPLLTSGLHGLAVATYDDWKAIVIGDDSAKVDLSFPLLQQLVSRIVSESAIDESDLKMFHCHPAMRDTYVKLCQDERVFYNVMKLDGGWEAVTYNGKPIVADTQCRRNAIFAIAPSSLSLMQMAPLDFMDKDGSVFYRISGGDVDAYGATAFVYQELGCKARNQNGLLKGLNEVWQ
ncbi:MAG: phage major capsid protein [Proteobacteria bacterium]|nr:phage major capsid protein [Pseudomonadota bacterium]